VCRVELGGRIICGKDKVCASERTILWLADATDVLDRFKRECALRVAHLWDIPTITQQYLETGDESIRDAAYVAAYNAARTAASAASCDSARAAASAASHGTVYNAACSAASAAVYGAAHTAECEWQNKRLTELLEELADSNQDDKEER